MPVYTFKCTECGKQQEVVRPMSQSDKPVYCEKDGKSMIRDLQADFGKQRHADIWPIVSTAAGIHPDEVQDQMKRDRKNGVPTEYRDGDPVLTSKSHRKAYLESRGIYDRNAGYGDPTPRNM